MVLKTNWCIWKDLLKTFTLSVLTIWPITIFGWLKALDQFMIDCLRLSILGEHYCMSQVWWFTILIQTSRHLDILCVHDISPETLALNNPIHKSFGIIGISDNLRYKLFENHCHILIDDSKYAVYKSNSSDRGPQKSIIILCGSPPCLNFLFVEAWLWRAGKCWLKLLSFEVFEFPSEACHAFAVIHEEARCLSLWTIFMWTTFGSWTISWEPLLCGVVVVDNVFRQRERLNLVPIKLMVNFDNFLKNCHRSECVKFRKYVFATTISFFLFFFFLDSQTRTT